MPKMDVIGIGLNVLNRVARSKWLENEQRRAQLGKVIYRGTRWVLQSGLLPGMGPSHGRPSTDVSPESDFDDTAADGRSSAPLFDLSLDDEQSMMADNLKRFALEVMRPAAAQANQDNAPPKDVLEMAQSLDLAKLYAQTEWGGVGERYRSVTQAIIFEALAYGDMGLALAILSPVSCVNVLSLFAQRSLCARYLPPLLTDQPVSASLALQEKGVLSNIAQPKMVAKKTRNGWKLTGTKQLVVLGHTAQFFIVSASISSMGKKTAALFVVDRSVEGLRIDDDPAMGLRAAQLCQLTLDGVTVPKDHRIGVTDEQANQIYHDVLRRSRMAWCAMGVGTAQAVVDYVIPYVNERMAFGEPISHRQAVAFKVADMATELDAMRLMLWRAASQTDLAMDTQASVALARKFAGDKAVQIGSDGVQLLGGHGFVTEHPVERWYRDLRAIAVVEGMVFI